jgi:ribosomal protein S18 acetylase RimI-like enzyme
MCPALAAIEIERHANPRMTETSSLTFRTIDPDADRSLVLNAYREAHRASFGDDRTCSTKTYLPWLRSRVEEFPDGHVLAFLGKRCIGQMELQVPYGLSTGYVNLFYVAPAFRGKGFGRAMHDRAEHYFRSWQADRIELDVSATNTRAVGFYRHLGYQLVRVEGRLWRMMRSLHHSPQLAEKRDEPS